MGKATSQGTTALQTTEVNQRGYDGTGITVGVISDSFDKGTDTADYTYATHADDDVRNGDLPGPGNPFGHTTPVDVVAEASTSGHFDEGRAMLQIVHDVAPGARLMFHAAGTTPETLAAAITSLRSQTNPSCDVIVDDFTFPEEPLFSDGPAVLAAKAAATSLVLPGRPVVYVSAAGNEGDVGYRADFAPISDGAARAGSGIGNLKLDQVPARLTAGGFHNFDPKPGKVKLGQQVKMQGAAEVVLQWDDPFLPDAVTADYNLLVFDAAGNYLADISGTSNNLSLGKALEVVDIPAGTLNPATHTFTVQLVIGRANSGTGLAQHLHYVMHGEEPIIKFAGYNVPMTFGHNAGADVIGVAAYDYRRLTEPETFSSEGPATIYFDAEGARLPTPEVRQEPAVAAVDGVDTSFFPPGPLTQADGTPGTDTDGDGLPNFYGTSAATPHIAGIAALLLQAAGGRGSLTGAQVLALLQNTGVPHDLDPNAISITLPDKDGAATTLSATGDESNAAFLDPNFLHLAFTGPADRSLIRVLIDLSGSGLVFDLSSDPGLPFTIGNTVGVSAGDVGTSLDPTGTELTLQFTPGVFTAGKAFDFNVGRRPVGSYIGGNSADLLAGATVKAFTYARAGRSKGKGVLSNHVGTGYSVAAGYGLVNASRAVTAALALPPTPKKAGLTSGDILVTASDRLILEITPDGTPVQIFALPTVVTSPSPGFVYWFAGETVVDGRGDLALLYDTSGASSLYLINPQNGQDTVLTAPGWAPTPAGNFSFASLDGEIVASGPYVFATNGQPAALGGRGALLRFDPATDTSQSFGQDSRGPYNFYGSLAVGADGLLYALDRPPEGGNTVDVYDPATLQRLRTVVLSVVFPIRAAEGNANAIAVGPTGEFYALSTVQGDATLYKLSASGFAIAALSLPGGANADYRTSNLRVNAQGAVLIGARDPVLVDPAFKTATVLSAFGDLPSDEYAPTATATFVP